MLSRFEKELARYVQVKSILGVDFIVLCQKMTHVII